MEPALNISKQTTMIALPPTISPTRPQFVQRVKDLKKQHQTKLHHFLTQSDENNMKMRATFFTDPIIRGYLARDSHNVQFEGNKPRLVSDVKDKEGSDYYECKIYTLAETKDRFKFIPYSRGIEADKFYSEGTFNAFLSLYQYVKNTRSNLVIPKRGVDIYGIRDALNMIELEKYFQANERSYGDIQFYALCNAKDQHATTVLSIFHKTERRLLTSVFINSWNTEDYFNMIEYRFNMKSRHQFFSLRRGDYYKPMIEKISRYALEKIQDRQEWIDKTTHEAFTLDEPDSVLQSDLEKEMAKGMIDFIHKVSPKKDLYYMCGARKVTFLNASHDLQIEKDDENCAIYAYNFLQGIATLLASDEMSERVYQLALKVDVGSDEEKETSRKEMIRIFQEELRRHLPCYYDSVGKPKEKAEIKDHHLRQRWDIDSLMLDPQSLRDRGYL